MNRPAHAAYRPLRRRPDKTVRPASSHLRVAAALGALLPLTALPSRAAEAAPVAAAPGPLDIVSHTPLWVWAVLVVLVGFGWRRTREREIGLPGLLLFPIVIVALSLSNLAGAGLPIASFAGLAIGGMLGVALGLTLERRNAPTPLGGGRLRLRGEWTSLAVVLAVFLTRYVRTVVGITHPLLAASEVFGLVTAGLSALFSLMLVTRTLLRLRIALRPSLA
ncbi:MAG: hypothetical protein P4M09_01305 [Devosia sp.]|nr:hypothetical protein [Devosia sp.]